MDIRLSGDSLQLLVAFLVYIVGVLVLGVMAQRFLTRGEFMKEYFLGNRGLGAWVLALTVAATAISGGTFMGFPSLIYSNGWVMALWICSYMVVPLTTMALLGKRINQAARLSGAVTVPDVLRDRFNSPALGILGSLLILFFLTFNLVAQFKGGGLVMREALALRPAEARFLDAEVAGKFLVLRFELTDGTVEVQKTPLPHEKARYLPEKTRVDEEAMQVEVHFIAEGRSLHKVVPFPPEKVALLGWFVIDKGYLLGLVIFAITVVAYTTYGGFWAVTWNDVLQGLIMLAGLLILVVLALQAVPPIEVNSRDEGGAVVTEELHGLPAATESLRRQDPQLVYGPGPGNFLPAGLALSFFLMWSLMAAGQPSGMVRLMSFKDSPSLRRALLLVCGYYLVTYVALLVVFICARAIFPEQYLRETGSEGEPDSIMPAMSRRLAHPLVAGLLLAAPYSAIMSTVAAFLLMISSSLVRDLYQRTINPQVSQRAIQLGTYAVTGLVGLVVMLVALNPPGYLQYLIVFTGSGQGCAFLLPMVLALYWRGATRAGILSSMLGGFLVVLLLYAVGWADGYVQGEMRAGGSDAAGLAVALDRALGWVPGWGEPRHDGFAPIYAFGLDPLVWGLLASLLLGIGVSLFTRRDRELEKKYFP